MRFCSLASGSSGNCLYIETEESKVLVDAGLSGKAIKERLDAIQVSPQEIDGLFVTHEHIDHIKGVGVLSRKYDLPVYATEKTWGQLESIGKIADKNQRYITKGSDEDLGDLKVFSFEVSHDAADPVGYTFHSKDKKLGVLTDTGYISEKMYNQLVGSDVLFLEANYDDKMLELGAYPSYLKQRIKGSKGHLSNTAAGKSLTQLLTGKTKRVMLAHLSAENNLPKLAYHTIKDILEDINLKVNTDLELEVAPRSINSEFVNL